MRHWRIRETVQSWMMSNKITDEMKSYLRQGERLDDLQCRGYYIIQNPAEFCFGMDAVLLADFATGKKGGRVIDLGTGTGVIPMLMEGREKGAHFVGLEIQEASAERAARSVEMNGLAGKIDIVRGDIREISVELTPVGTEGISSENFPDNYFRMKHPLYPQADYSGVIKKGSFDCVTSNPPYIKGGRGLENADSPKNIARHETLVTLEEVVAAASYLLVSGGSFAMVHKPFRLAEIIRTLSRYRLEPKRMCLVQPYIDKEPNMVLIEAVKDGGVQLSCEPTLVVYNKDGSYTEDLLHRYGEYR